MRIGNSIINPEYICSAKMIPKKDWLGIRDGYAIRCELTDGRRVDLLDSDGRGFTYISASSALDKIEEVLERAD